MIGWGGGGGDGGLKSVSLRYCWIAFPHSAVLAKCWFKGEVGEQFPQSLILTSQFNSSRAREQSKQYSK